MITTHAKWFPLFGAMTFGLALAAPTSLVSAHEGQCGKLSETVRASASSSEAFTTVAKRNLYRFQERPWARMPTGAAIKVSAPAGMTEADVHNAARCGAMFQDGASPLDVPGASLAVRRNGGYYELHFTAQDRGAAREIQARVAQLP